MAFPLGVLRALLAAPLLASASRLRSRPEPPGGARPEPLHGRAAEAVAAAAAASAAASAAARDARGALAEAGHPLPPEPPLVDLHIREGQQSDWSPFEGIGALSAGASSRLLRDYPKEQRAEILDLLFKPGYGASLQVLKVEIGGDMQSTDGSEPSHKRTRSEQPDCTRGYETWLMQEAKARNPKLRTYGLAWGVPGWIGNGSFFTPDNIDYHISWLECIRTTYGFQVDYIGIWNEMQWGKVWYMDALAQGIAAKNLSTRLVLLDAIHGVDQGFLDFFSRNETFRSLVDAVGLHYPCEETPALAKALAPHRGTRFWASEELSTVADWGGAGCWGRMINQNYVRMNATSSIAWSLVWSAYPNLECFGNGLLYAYEPWSGHYEVNPPIWTTAHTTQFTEVGWQYLPAGMGAGLLPGGGTFVTLVSPTLDDFTIVLETLQGSCFYHSGCYHTKEATAPQRVRLHLGNLSTGIAAAAAHRGSNLEVWATNRTHWFLRQPDARVDSDGTLEVTLGTDAVLTLTTLRGASKRGERDGGHAERGKQKVLKSSPPSTAFPLPFQENFDSHDSARDPPFFADQGGAFEMVADTESEGASHGSEGNASLHSLRRFHSNKVLEQQVLVPPIAWIGHSPEPFTLVGGVNWTSIGAEVSVRLGALGPHAADGAADRRGARLPDASNGSAAGDQGPAPRHAGLCVRISRYQYFGGAQSVPEGYCLQIYDTASPTWLFTAADQTLATGQLAPADADRVSAGGWLHLRLEAREAQLRVRVNGHEVARVTDTTFPFGQVALRCGYHRCQFDDLHIAALPALPPAPPGAPAGGRRALLRSANIASFHYHSRSCDPAPRLARRRRDFSGFIGFAFVPRASLSVKALGRLAVSGGHPWAQVHNVSLFEQAAASPPLGNAGPRLVASVALPMAAVDQVGVERAEDGWVFAELRKPVLLQPDREYVLVSSELANGDAFYDKAVRADADPDVTLSGPAFLDTTGWHVLPEAPMIYGPLNALLGPAPAARAATPLSHFGHSDAPSSARRE